MKIINILFNMRTYYLLIDKEFLYNLFNNLQETRMIEPGIDYIKIKDDNLAPYIVIKSIYKDEYFKERLTTLLRNINFEGRFEILKPLVREQVMHI